MTSLIRIKIAGTAMVMLLFASTIFVLLIARPLNAETSGGMINRAPLVEAIPEPTELEKISNNLSDIVKSINEVPEEESVMLIEESVILIAEPKEPEEKKAAPVIAKPNKISPKPAKVKTARKTPEKEAEKPVVTITKKPVPVEPAPVEMAKVKPAKPVVKTGYSKFNNEGKELNKEATLWSCTEDAQSGLMWEVKSDNNGIRDKDHLYSWFDPSNKQGLTDGGRCKGDIDCDTNAYVQAINKLRLCGYDDWRLPTHDEMQSLVYFDKKNTGIRINSKYFPQTMASWYWTASSNTDNPGYAWYVLFKNGISLNDLKERPKHIRLVRKKNKA